MNDAKKLLENEKSLYALELLSEIIRERLSQIDKFGLQNMPFSDGASLLGEFGISEHDARRFLENKRGRCTWLDVLLEEICEADSTKDAYDKIDRSMQRKELIQCAAVIFAAIENLDRGEPV